MKKRVLSIMLALCMIFTLLPVSALAAEAATSGSCGKNATWSYADGTLTISGTGELKQYDGDNPAPWSAYESEIKNIVIEDGITTVTESCFQGSVETVSFGSTVKISGRNPFVYLNDLKSVAVSEKNTAYCAVDGVLYNKSMTTLIAYPAAKDDSSFTVPGTVSTVGDSAFSECFKLTGITLPDSMTKLDTYAFYYCKNLKSITMPKKLDSIGDHAFASCQSLTEMTVPEGVAVIENGAFYGCRAFKSATLPSTLKEIGKAAFKGCTALSGITLPTGLRTIGAGAFAESGLVEAVIPEGVTAIPDSCFADCRLTSVTIPVSVRSIGNSAFIPGDGDAMTINYRGTKAQWKQISVEDNNPRLDKAIVVCNYK